MSRRLDPSCAVAIPPGRRGRLEETEALHTRPAWEESLPLERVPGGGR
ncbi:MAG: hypothetical protein HY298_12295 [Verrucomicrobia bacterium]|nr:hypothetical protein [Verrucomicrobiota bacterium]